MKISQFFRLEHAVFSRKCKATFMKLAKKEYKQCTANIILIYELFYQIQDNHFLNAHAQMTTELIFYLYEFCVIYWLTVNTLKIHNNIDDIPIKNFVSKK